MALVRARILLVVAAVLGVSCSASSDPRPSGGFTPTSRSSPTPTAEERLERIRRVTSGACTPGHNAAAYFAGTGLYCLPFDSIPAVDDPTFTRPEGRLDIPDVEPVATIEIEGKHRAYPIRYLSTHEIVNDVVAGRPVAVTFCPLCNSAVAFDREMGGRTLTFGVSGQLLSGNLVMFDRETISLWQQVTGKAFNGSFRGRVLDQIPTRMVSFGAWRAEYPNGKVMAPPQRGRDYGRDPYAGYALNPNQESKFFRPPPESGIDIRTDPRLPPKWRVIGVKSGGRSVAFAEPEGRGRRAVAESSATGAPLVALFERDTSRTSTSARLSDSPRGWAGAVWVARIDGRTLDIQVEEDGFVDRVTGSTFTLLGRATSGPLQGRRLKAAPQVTAFWFSWVDSYPQTEVVRAK